MKQNEDAVDRRLNASLYSIFAAPAGELGFRDENMDGPNHALQPSMWAQNESMSACW